MLVIQLVSHRKQAMTAEQMSRLLLLKPSFNSSYMITPFVQCECRAHSLIQAAPDNVPIYIIQHYSAFVKPKTEIFIAKGKIFGRMLLLLLRAYAFFRLLPDV